MTQHESYMSLSIDRFRHIEISMRFFFIVVIALSFSGCAFTNYTLHLPEGIGAGLHGGEGRKIYVNIPFADMRPDQSRCGMQKNGYNMDTASGTCSQEPAAWLAKILARELRAAGFEILAQSEGSIVDAVHVEGQLLQVFVEPVIGFWTIEAEADVHVKLVLQSDSGFKAERNFYIKASHTSLLATPELMQGAMSEAVTQTVVQMVAAIVSIMDRYPQLGMNGVSHGG